MEHYYFIQKNGIKKGPFKLTELKTQTIYFDELIWRSDADTWKKASEFNELVNTFIVRPPLTQVEKEKKSFYKKYINKILPSSIFIYFTISIIVSVISFIIASNEWESTKDKYLVNKNKIGNILVDSDELDRLENDFKKNEQELKKFEIELSKAEKKLDSINQNHSETFKRTGLGGGTVTQFDSKKTSKEYMKTIDELDLLRSKVQNSKWRLYSSKNDYEEAEKNYRSGKRVEPIYKIPKSIISQENSYGLRQQHLFRTYYAFFSKIHLTTKEQEKSWKLFVNLTFSSLVTNLIFLLTFLIFFFIYKSKI